MPLIVTNCLIVARAESFAAHQRPGGAPLLDGLGHGAPASPCSGRAWAPCRELLAPGAAGRGPAGRCAVPAGRAGCPAPGAGSAAGAAHDAHGSGRRCSAACRQANPHPTTELVYHTPFELLVAVILSAQATDVSVNKATAGLFPVANTPGGHPGARRGRPEAAHQDDRPVQHQGEEHPAHLPGPARRARRRGAPRPGGPRGAAGRGAQDRERGAEHRLRRADDRRRHAHLPRRQPHGTGTRARRRARSRTASSPRRPRGSARTPTTG